MAEKRTPRKERLEIASMVDSLPEVLLPPLGVADAPALVPALDDAAAPPEELPVGVDDAEEEEAEPEGRPVKTAELVKVLQLEEEGILGSYGLVMMGPRDSGG